MKNLFLVALSSCLILASCGKNNESSNNKKAAKSFSTLPEKDTAIEDLRETRWISKNQQIIVNISKSGDSLSFEKANGLSRISGCTEGKFLLEKETDRIHLSPTNCNMIVGNKKIKYQMGLLKLVDNKLKLYIPSSYSTNSIESEITYIEFNRD
ncbi:hypothetical protein ACWNT8_09790 [Pigmentibacter ruber]